MKRQTTVLYVFLMLTTALLPAINARAAEPTLQETITWLQNTIKERGRATINVQNDRWHYSTVMNSYDWDTNVMVLQETLTYQDRDGDFQKNVTTWTFALKDMAPPDIQRQAWVTLLTTDKQEVVSCKEEKENTASYARKHVYNAMRSGLNFNVDSEEIGDRITKAFSHAIKLCGGKPSAPKAPEPF